MKKNNTINEVMQREKARAKTIHRVFFYIDNVMMVVILCTEGYFYKQYFAAQSSDEKMRIIRIIYILPAILEVVFSLLLTVSACYIASWLKRSFGKK